MEKTIYEEILEINNSINEYKETSKLPKFITNYITSKQKKKLLNNVEGIRKSKKSLTVNELENFILDIFVYCKNGSYGNIFWTKNIIDEEKNIDIIESCYIDNKYKAVFKINNNYSKRHPSTKFDLQIKARTKTDKNVDVYENYNLNLDSLYSANKNYKNILYEMNTRMNNEICNFLQDVINGDLVLELEEEDITIDLT